MLVITSDTICGLSALAGFVVLYFTISAALKGHFGTWAKRQADELVHWWRL